MSSSKVINQLLLGSVAFGISCGLGLVVIRDLNKALLTGAISLPAVYGSALVVDKRRSHPQPSAVEPASTQWAELADANSTLLDGVAAVDSGFSTDQGIGAQIDPATTFDAALDLFHNEGADENGQIELEHPAISEESRLQQEEWQSDLERLKVSHQEFTTQIQELEQQVATLEAERQALHDTLTPLQQHYQDITTRLQHSQEDLYLSQQHLSNAQAQEQQLREEITTLTTQHQELTAQTHALEKQVAALEAQRLQLESEVAPAQQAQTLSSELGDRQSELELLLDQISQAQQQRGQVQLEVDRLSDRHQELVTETNHLQGQLTELKQEHDQLQQVFDAHPQSVMSQPEAAAFMTDDNELEPMLEDLSSSASTQDFPLINGTASETEQPESASEAEEDLLATLPELSASASEEDLLATLSDFSASEEDNPFFQISSAPEQDQDDENPFLAEENQEELERILSQLTV